MSGDGWFGDEQVVVLVGEPPSPARRILGWIHAAWESDVTELLFYGFAAFMLWQVFEAGWFHGMF